MEHINSIINTVYFNNSVQEYIYALGLMLVIIVFIKLIKHFVVKKIEQNNDEKSQNEFINLTLDIIKTIPGYFFWSLYFYFPLKTLNLHSGFIKYLEYGFILVLVLEATNIIHKIIVHFLSKNILKDDYGNQQVTTYNLFKITTKVILRVVGILFFMSNIGIQVGPLLASLGVGGIVLAFALQNILEDIFSSFTIYLDKPFHIGDSIIIGTDRGTVTKIGIKSTRIRTVEGQELVVSNRDLTTARIQNFGKMTKRRIEITFGVTYETPIEKLKQIPQLVEQIFVNLEDMEFDTVRFIQLADYSLNFTLYYFINSNDFNDYIASKDTINYALIETFQKNNINFAYPTQLLYLNK